jgi:two-component system nitrate/nitrite response regulator NarL
VLTLSEARSDFFFAINFGARAYIRKDIRFEDLVKTISLAATGKVIVAPPIAEAVLDALKSLNHHRHMAKAWHISLLTEKERAVLALVAQDAYNKEIADALFITENTVKVHLRNIMHKLNARSRLEVVACAIEEGLPHSLAETNAKPM